MAYFRDEREVYDTIGRLLVGLLDDEALMASLRPAGTVIRYSHRDPEATITARLTEEEPPCVDLGDSLLDPDVVISMDTDTAHRFWLGELNPTVALARGQIRAKGPVTKVLRLVPHVKPVFACYRAQLEQQGRGDLLRV